MDELNLNFLEPREKEVEPLSLEVAPTVEDPRTMDEIFRSLLPKSLFMSHYELHDLHPQFEVEEWRKYLRDNDKFITRETALLTEVNARKALDSLANGNGREASAIKQLLDRSEYFTNAIKGNQTFVTMFVPSPITPAENKNMLVPLDEDEYIVNHLPKFEAYQENRKIVDLFYPDRETFRARVLLGEIIENSNGTLHFPMKDKITHLDRIYIVLFNPDNELKDDRL